MNRYILGAGQYILKAIKYVIEITTFELKKCKTKVLD